MKTRKGFSVRTLPLYVVETQWPEDELDVFGMVKLNMSPAPILWDYHGAYFLVPMQHVADVMDSVRRHMSIEKTAWNRPTISMGDATPLDYEVGYTLSRRPSGKKLESDKR